MFSKFLNVQKFNPFSRRTPSKPATTLPEMPEEASSPLKIVHVGGIAECYYMAIPASTILEKYPAFVLARPEVFRRPWDSLIRPEAILIPGEKFFLIPRRTMRKLRKRTRRPSGDVSITSFISQSWNDASVTTKVSHCQNDVSSSMFSRQTDISNSSEVSSSFGGSRKKSGIKKHVRFAGIEVKQVKAKEKKGKEVTCDSRKSLDSQAKGGKRRSRNPTWQPMLASITEN